MGFFAKDIGIDLGTANILIYMKNKGIVAKEPSVVAIDKKNGRVCEVGLRAKTMIGRTPGNIVAVRPLREGVIADFSTTSAMIKYFIQKTTANNVIGKPKIIICIPYGVTEVERRAVIESGIQSGAREVLLIEEPMAAAVGAGLSVELPSGVMVVDIGGGTTEVAVISLNGVVSCKSVSVAGDKFDHCIISYIRRKYNVLIGERTAEELKMNLGSAVAPETESFTEASGRDVISGLPKTIAVSSKDIREALTESLFEMLDAIKSTLEVTPPELSADVMQHGITLTGGGALIKGLDEFLSEQLEIPVHVADNPLNCVVNGIGKVMEKEDKYSSVLFGLKRK